MTDIDEVRGTAIALTAQNAELLTALELVTDSLSKALTGGAVSAKRAGHALVTAADLIAKQKP
ncbi:hypothetical protein F3K50_16290 [Pseudomonas marginalis]|nr:hypothetical protein F3K50_16290 [Pseudomonas marginalis]